MKIALTGGTGGVGTELALTALARGHGVRALARDPARAAHLARAGAEIVRGDLESTGALDELARGADAFVHAAAQVGDTGTPEAFERVNVGGTRNVVEAAARQKVRRFVQVSSVAVYGRPEHGAIEEDFPPIHCDSPYEATKRDAERLAFERGRELGIEVAAVRPPIIMGPYDQQFLPRMVEQLRTRRAPYIDGGRAPLNLVSSVDVVDVLLRCAQHPAAAGEAFNVAAAPPPRVREVLDTVADAAGLPRPLLSIPAPVARGLARVLERAWSTARLPSKPPITAFVVAVFTRNVVYDATKARRMLGWEGGRRPLDDLRALAAKFRVL